MKYSHLLFDMDNTLYPASSDMDKGITRRMLECVAEFFHCDMEQAAQLRAERIVHYSTTLEWLRAEGMSDIEGFLAHVHPDNEADELQPQPKLREFLLSLPYPKSILTNALHVVSAEFQAASFTVLAFNLLGEAIRDIFDPKEEHLE